MEDYYWEATLNDGTIIKENNNGVETLFKEVENNKDKLLEFKLVENTDKDPKHVHILLNTGAIEVNGNIIREGKENPKKFKCELLFKKTRTTAFNQDLSVSQPLATVYKVGIRGWNDVVVAWCSKDKIEIKDQF